MSGRHPELDLDFRDRKKIEARLAKEYYLRQHPELRQLCTRFVVESLQHQPQDLILFARTFFTLRQLRSMAQEGQKMPIDPFISCGIITPAEPISTIVGNSSENASSAMPHSTSRDEIVSVSTQHNHPPNSNTTPHATQSTSGNPATLSLRRPITASPSSDTVQTDLSGRIASSSPVEIQSSSPVRYTPRDPSAAFAPHLRLISLAELRDVFSVPHGGASMATIAQFVMGARMGAFTLSPLPKRRSADSSISTAAVGNVASPEYRALHSRIRRTPTLFIIGGNILAPSAYSAIPIRASEENSSLPMSQVAPSAGDKERPNLLAIDVSRSGGCYPMMQIITDSGVDIISIGNRDFDLACDIMLDVLDRYPMIDWVSTNVRFSERYTVSDQSMTSLVKGNKLVIKDNYHHRENIKLIHGANRISNNLFQYMPLLVGHDMLLFIVGVVEHSLVSVSQLTQFGAVEVFEDYMESILASIDHFWVQCQGEALTKGHFRTASLVVYAHCRQSAIDQLTQDCLGNQKIQQLFGSNITIFDCCAKQASNAKRSPVVRLGASLENIAILHYYSNPVRSIEELDLLLEKRKKHVQGRKRQARLGSVSNLGASRPTGIQLDDDTTRTIDLTWPSGNALRMVIPMSFQEESQVDDLEYYLLEKAGEVAEREKEMMRSMFIGEDQQGGTDGLNLIDFSRYLMKLDTYLRQQHASKFRRGILDGNAARIVERRNTVMSGAGAPQPPGKLVRRQTIVGQPDHADAEVVAEAYRLFKYLDISNSTLVTFDEYWDFHTSLITNFQTRRLIRRILHKYHNVENEKFVFNFEQIQETFKQLPRNFGQDERTYELFDFMDVTGIGLVSIADVWHRTSVTGFVDTLITRSNSVYHQISLHISNYEMIAMNYYGTPTSDWHKPLIGIGEGGQLNCDTNHICSRPSAIGSILAKSQVQESFLEKLADADYFPEEDEINIVSLFSCGSIKLDCILRESISVRDVCCMISYLQPMYVVTLSHRELVELLVTALSHKFSSEGLFHSRPVYEGFPAMGNFGIVFNIDIPHNSFLFDLYLNTENTFDGACKARMTPESHPSFCVILDEYIKNGGAGYFHSIATDRWKMVDIESVSQDPRTVKLNNLIEFLKDEQISTDVLLPSRYSQETIWFCQADETLPTDGPLKYPRKT